MKKVTVKVSSLADVPELKNFYSEQPIAELVESIKKDGLKVPIIISSDNEIIDGYRRVEALRELGVEDVDVLVDEIQPELDERVLRNMYRKKTTVDEVKEMRTIFLRYPKRQGKRNNGQPYSRAEQISNALNKRWKDEEVLNKLEYLLNNDFENDFLPRAIVEKRADVEPCYEFLKENKKIDEVNNYGFKERLLNGEITVKQANKFIDETDKLNKKYKPTFSIPQKSNFYLQDCKEVEKLEKYYNKIDTLITSIPYYQIENYEIGGESQLGHEKTKEEYAENVVEIFKKQIPLLKKTANVFINVGETYQDGLGLGIPYLIQNYLSQNTELKYKGTIYWSKKNPKPQSDKVKRDTDSVEHVLWFVLDSNLFKYTKLTYLENTEWKTQISNGAKDVSKNGKRSKKVKSLKKPYKKFYNHLREQEIEDIVRTSVGGNHDLLKISSEGHPCPFNPLLVLNLILMSTLRDDNSLIYDCFSGASITGQVATLLNKKFLGVELNKKYFDIGCEVLVNSNKMFDSDSLKFINDFVYQENQPIQLSIAA